MATYKLHIFTSTANLTVNSLGGSPSYNNIEYIVLAGGGGGGKNDGAGGGAGGLLLSNLILSPSNIGETVVTVGAGGAITVPGATNITRTGLKGSNSSISLFGLNAVGGGGGGGQWFPGTAPGRPEHYLLYSAGGSGGGASTTGPFAGATGISGQGFPGGSNVGPGSNPPSGAGGGGAGGAGSPTSPPASGGAGGPGIPISWIPASYGTPGPAPGRWLGGGGGGGGSTNPTSGLGGAGGGGTGGRGESPWPNGTGGSTNTGGGGGGGHSGVATGQAGGSGLVVIKYLKGAPIVDGKVSRITQITANTSILAPNISVVFSINTARSTEGETYYYDTLGNATNSSFVEGNTGTFSVSSNVGTVTLTASNSVDEIFKLRVRRSNTSSVMFESDNVTAVTSVSYIDATGGTETTVDGYKIHTFTSSDSLTINSLATLSSDNNIEYLVVAGGGAGGFLYQGNFASGGGGAGGILQGNLSVTAKTYTIAVGGGGTIGSLGNPGTAGQSGSNSSIDSDVIAVGGGKGWDTYHPSLGGGSGGGRAGAGTVSAGISGQGYPGGQGSPSTPVFGGGGGGGAEAAGSNGTGPAGGPGGIGRSISWVPASYGTTGPAPGRYFSGGGGGGNGGSGGAGGGGNSGVPGNAGTINTGGGGGSGSWNPPTGSPGGAGGSGIVIVRYRVE